MLTRFAPLVIAIALSACGSSIGDECTTGADCAQDGTRVCDFSMPGGYCTIEACDFDTCPEEAVCVRFYPGLMTGRACDRTDPSSCDLDEVCTVQGLCAPRTIERRFCMLACDGDGDCRSGYECRTSELRELHGGEAVPNPDTGAVSDAPFCAARPPCVFDSDCADPGYRCVDRFCSPE